MEACNRLQLESVLVKEKSARKACSIQQTQHCRHTVLRARMVLAIICICDAYGVCGNATVTPWMGPQKPLPLDASVCVRALPAKITVAMLIGWAVKPRLEGHAAHFSNHRVHVHTRVHTSRLHTHRHVLLLRHACAGGGAWRCGARAEHRLVPGRARLKL
jgi:hypothetical protein